MNWNDYIDRSYEYMLAAVNDIGFPQSDLSEKALRDEVEDLACMLVREKDDYTSEKDVCGIVFDDFAREDLEETYYLGRFLDAVQECHPVKADRIAQMAANEINIDCIVQYCLEFDD